MNRAQKHFSPNCTASIRNPLSVSVLTFRHLSLLMPPLVCEMIFTRKGPNEGKGRGFSKPVLQSKTGLSIACGLCCIILLLASRSYSQNSRILPEWKDHFKASLVITNCVFERRIAPDKKNLYQFRYQKNAFMVREIRSLEEAASNRTAILNVYAGRFGSNYWSIGPGEILRYFPNAEKMMKERKNADAALVYSAETRIYSALYYGINGLDPATVKWPEEAKFTASAFSRESLSGEILEISDGRPTLLDWHFEQNPATHFILEYGYDLPLGLPYYPSEIRLYRKETGGKVWSATHKISVFDTSDTPLGEHIFRPTNHLGSQVVTVVFTNNDIYTFTPGGTLTKVLPMSAQPLNVPDKRATKTFRIFFLSFLALSLASPYLIWRRYRNKKQK